MLPKLSACKKHFQFRSLKAYQFVTFAVGVFDACFPRSFDSFMAVQVMSPSDYIIFNLSASFKNCFLTKHNKA